MLIAQTVVWIRALRPRQWPKNLVVFAPLIFAQSGESWPLVARASAAFFAFCALAGSVYLGNDWVDRERDRIHPTKRKRPIASGQMSGVSALVVGISCFLTAVMLAVHLGRSVVLALGAYVVLQVAYTLWLKHVVLIDVMAIAAGFILRAVVGSAAIDVQMSNWLFLCTLLLAVFLGFAKRRHEVTTLSQAASAHRSNLADYNAALLDQLMSVSAASTIVAYGLYTMSRETVERIGNDRLKFTLPCVIYGLFRYFYLVYRKGEGGAPERLALSDPPLFGTLVVYTAIVVWAVYGG